MVFWWLVIVAKLAREPGRNWKCIFLFLCVWLQVWRCWRHFHRCQSLELRVFWFCLERWWHWRMANKMVSFVSSLGSWRDRVPSSSEPASSLASSLPVDTAPGASHKGKPGSGSWSTIQFGEPKIWRNLFYLLMVYFPFSLSRVTDYVWSQSCLLWRVWSIGFCWFIQLVRLQGDLSFERLPFRDWYERGSPFSWWFWGGIPLVCISTGAYWT